MISVVIPSFNRKDHVLALLADLSRQEGVDYEIIVVDDCSLDGSYEAIAAAYPQVKLLKNAVNGGPAVTRNRGVTAARGDIIVGFDSDVTVPDTRVLAKVAETFAKMPQVDGLAFRIFAADGVTDDKPRWWHPVPIERYSKRLFETCYFSGTAYAFRKEPMMKAGLFPEWLYMHYEEVVLAYRIIDCGGSLVYDPELTAVHHARPTPRRGKIKTFYKPRNQILLALTCYPSARAMWYLLPRLAFGMTEAAFSGYLDEYWRALRSAGSMKEEIKRRRSPLRSAAWKKIRAVRSGLQPTLLEAVSVEPIRPCASS